MTGGSGEKVQAGGSNSDVQAVLVLRHASIPLAMKSDLWKKYNFTKVFEIQNPETKKPITENVFWQPKQGSGALPTGGGFVARSELGNERIVPGALPASWCILDYERTGRNSAPA